MSGKDKKLLKTNLAKIVNPDAAASFVDKAEKIIVQKIQGTKSLIFIENQNPMLVDATGSNQLFPTIYFLMSFPGCIPNLIISQGVEEAIFKGANLMWPGVQSDSLPKQYQKDLMVAVMNSKRQYIGIGALGTDSKQGKKQGVAVTILNHINDALWSHGDRTNQLARMKFQQKENQIQKKKQVQKKQQQKQEKIKQDPMFLANKKGKKQQKKQESYDDQEEQRRIQKAITQKKNLNVKPPQQSQNSQSEQQKICKPKNNKDKMKNQKKKSLQQSEQQKPKQQGKKKKNVDNQQQMPKQSKKKKGGEDTDDQKPKQQGKKKKGGEDSDDQKPKQQGKKKKGGEDSDDQKPKHGKKKKGGEDSDDQKPKQHGKKKKGGEDSDDQKPKQQGKKKKGGEDSDDQKPKQQGKKKKGGEDSDDQKPKQHGKKKKGGDGSQDQKPKPQGKKKKEEDDTQQPALKNKKKKGKEDSQDQKPKQQAKKKKDQDSQDQKPKQQTKKKGRQQLETAGKNKKGQQKKKQSQSEQQQAPLKIQLKGKKIQQSQDQPILKNQQDQPRKKRGRKRQQQSDEQFNFQQDQKRRKKATKKQKKKRPNQESEPQDAKKADESQQQADKKAKPKEQNKALQQQMDQLLKQSFLNALKLGVNDKKLPIDGGNLYSQYILKCRPEQSHIQIKNSSYKKISKFYQVMQSKGLIECSMLKDKKSGNQALQITKIVWKNEQIADWQPTIAKMRQKQQSQQESIDGICQKDLFDPQIEVTKLYKPEKHQLDSILFFGLNKQQLNQIKALKPLLTHQEVQQKVNQYLNKQGVEQEKGQWKIDIRKMPYLGDLLKQAQEEQSKQDVHDEQLQEIKKRKNVKNAQAAKASKFILLATTNQICNKLQENELVEYHRLKKAGIDKTKKGPFIPLEISLQKTHNRNVTKIIGLQNFIKIGKNKKQETKQEQKGDKKEKDKEIAAKMRFIVNKWQLLYACTVNLHDLGFGRWEIVLHGCFTEVQDYLAGHKISKDLIKISNKMDKKKK